MFLGDFWFGRELNFQLSVVDTQRVNVTFVEEIEFSFCCLELFDLGGNWCYSQICNLKIEFCTIIASYCFR